MNKNMEKKESKVCKLVSFWAVELYSDYILFAKTVYQILTISTAHCTALEVLPCCVLCAAFPGIVW